jgi:hypothetical protein
MASPSAAVGGRSQLELAIECMFVLPAEAARRVSRGFWSEGRGHASCRWSVCTGFSTRSDQCKPEHVLYLLVIIQALEQRVAIKQATRPSRRPRLSPALLTRCTSRAIARLATSTTAQRSSAFCVATSSPARRSRRAEGQRALLPSEPSLLKRVRARMLTTARAAARSAAARPGLPAPLSGSRARPFCAYKWAARRPQLCRAESTEVRGTGAVCHSQLAQQSAELPRAARGTSEAMTPRLPAAGSGTRRSAGCEPGGHRRPHQGQQDHPGRARRRARVPSTAPRALIRPQADLPPERLLGELARRGPAPAASQLAHRPTALPPPLP